MDIKFITEIAIQKDLVALLDREQSLQKLAKRLNSSGCYARSNYPGTDIEYADFLLKEILCGVAFGSITNQRECDRMLRKWYDHWGSNGRGKGKKGKGGSDYCFRDKLDEIDIFDSWVRGVITDTVLSMDGKK